MADEKPYGFDPTFEWLIAELCASNKQFWRRMGVHVDPDRIVTKAPKKIIQACRAINAEGRSPSHPTLVAQRVRRWTEDGKITLDEHDECKELLQDAIDDAKGFDIDNVIEEMKPVVRAMMEKQALEGGFDLWSRGADVSRVTGLLEKAKRIGASEQALGSRLHADFALDIFRNAQMSRLKTGINELDREIGGGIRRGTMTVFTGATGVGKSFTVDQIVAGCIAPYSGDVGMPSAIATVGELTDEDHYARIIANLTNIPYTLIQENEKYAKRAQLRMSQLEQEGFLSFSTCRYFDALETTVDEVFEWLKSEEDFYGIEIPVLCIDYAMNLKADSKKARHEEIKTIAAKLRSWAKQNNKWVITPHQGTGDTMKEGKPITADNSNVAEGKGIARSADLHITLNKREDETIAYYVAKNTHGSSGMTVGPLETDFERGKVYACQRYGWPF